MWRMGGIIDRIAWWFGSIRGTAGDKDQKEKNNNNNCNILLFSTLLLLCFTGRGSLITVSILAVTAADIFQNNQQHAGMNRLLPDSYSHCFT